MNNICRQIIARLTQTLDENSGTGQKLVAIYSDLGISLKNEEGQLRSTYEILGDLAKQWDKLDSDTQQYIALTSAGSNQVNNFLALMKNFNTAIAATATAYNSVGSAMKENEAYMDSIGAKLNLIKANFQQLVNGDGGLNTLIKLILDATNGLLEFANSGLGKVTLVFAALSLTISGVYKNLNVITDSIITLFGKVIPQNVLLSIASGQGFSGVLTAMKTNILALSTAEKTSLILGAAAVVAAGIYAISKAMGALGDDIKSVSDEIKEATDLESTAKGAEAEIKNLKSQLKDIEDQINEIDDLTLKVSNAEDYTRLQAQSNELKNQEQTLKNQLAIQIAKEESAKREHDLIIQNLKDSQGYASFSSYHDDDTTAINSDGNHATLEQSFKEGMTAAVLLNRAIADVRDEINNLDKSSETYEEDLAELQDKEKEYEKTLGEVKDQMVNTVDAAGQIIEANQDTDGTIQGLLDRWNMLTGVTDAVSKSIEALSDDEEDTAKNTQEAADLMSTLSDSLGEVGSAYDALKAAYDEYNQYGSLSLNTLNTLLEKYPQYIQYLYDENGNINLNTDALLTLAEARKADALQQVAQAEAADLQAYSEGNLNNVSETGKAILEAYGNKVKYVGEEADKAADKVVEYAYAVAAANVASGAPVEGATLEGLNALKAGWDNIRKTIAETDVAVTTHNENTKRTSKSNKDAAKEEEKEAKEAAKAYEEAYEKEEAVLEHMHEMGEISDEEFYRRLLELNERYFGEASGHHEEYLDKYLKNEEKVYKGLVSAYKDKVKKQKDAALKAIEAEIKAVKKAKDAALKAIDEKIKALKKQKEAAVKAIEAEIKALEKAKETQHKYLQEKIDALQRAHDLQEKINQLEEYENQLAQAKQQRVWVMKDGQFQLGENEEAINSAEQQLSDYKDDLDYERQLQELQDLQEYWDEYYDNLIEKKEEYKEYIENYYDEQIEALEEYRDRVEEEYDAQIEALEEYKDQVEEMYDNMLENYQEHVEKMLEAFDKFNEGNSEKYGKAIEDLKAFVAEWNALIGSMSSIDGAIGGMVSGMVSLKGHSAGAAEIGSYASGNSSSVKDNEIALVGESPNTEMLIGSKVNSGVVARLHKGSGVVNAESTKTLAGILNSLGKNKYVGSSGVGGGVTQQFSFGSITLPNVTDANSFVETLRNTFGTYTVQYATAKG